VKSLRVRLTEEWGVTRNAVLGKVGVLARGGKVLNELADTGYVAPELASWVDPTSGTASTPASEVPQGVPPSTSEGVEALEDPSKGGQGVPPGTSEVPETPHTPSAAPQRLPISRQQPSYGQGNLGRGLGVGHPQLGVDQVGGDPQTPPQGPLEVPPRGPFQGPSAALTPEEVALLASNHVTYQNGRWLHTELTPSGYVSRFVDPRVELNKIYGEDEGARVMTSVGGQMLNTLTIQTGLL